MKFVCDGCGKKYATAEDPSPGKVYKLRCKACGHLIVVKAQAGTSTGIPALTAAELASGGSGTPPGSSAPELEIEVEPEVQSNAPSRVPPTTQEPEPVDDDAVIQEPAPLPPEAATAPPASALPAIELEASASALPPPPPPGKDELADFAAAAAEVMATPLPGADAAAKSGYVDLFGDGITGERPVAAPAPAAASARGTSAEGPASASPAAPPRIERSAPGKDATPKPAPAKVAPAKPPSRSTAKKGGPPLAIIGLGVVLLGVITAVAISTGGSKQAEPPPAVAPPAPRPAPIPAPVAEPAAAPEPKVEPRVEPPPAKVEPPAPAPRPVVAERKPEPARPRPVERKPEPKPEPRPEPKPEPRVAAAPPPAPVPEPVEARTETRDVQLADAETALTPEVVQKVINANRKAFAGCIASAGSDVKLDGRRVALKLTVNANGAVTYPTLDDVTLNPTEMGQCLKSAARLMIFPKFKGDPFHVEVPLTLTN